MDWTRYVRTMGNDCFSCVLIAGCFYAVLTSKIAEFVLPHGVLQRYTSHKLKSITLRLATDGVDQQLTAGRFGTHLWILTTHLSGIVSPYVSQGRVRRIYQNCLLESLPNAPPSDVNAYWDEIATPLHSCGNLVCATAQPDERKHWISDQTVALLKSWRNIEADPEHNPVQVLRQVEVGVRADHEVWWTQKAKELEAQKAGNASRLLQLIRATGPQKPPVSETIKNQN
ncbi:LOW QUALITY PROTEIN: hypothetical protein T265_14128 [Opisthorchis viverrini]|uniref:Uncharacterized protein n=1 Tax=Opisthorchis viverrini TaxID=6198 RepID=A0A074ZR92_OPIVI|nr:LOW QUALITY PROTEIN: hypothetical protein T265_14128 [Opisthorchis viverrini]KER25860.1 LOW QUALITY PROTEIN: hypothetical protein T265_14128 [Opisthorchis viverrini]